MQKNRFARSQNDRKGLTRIGRPISDISNAMQNQGQLEVSKLEKT